MLATDFEVGGINDACSGSPGNYFLTLSLADLEIIIEEPSWVDWYAFPVFAQILDCEIREFDFLTNPVFHTRAVRSALFKRGISATDQSGESQHAAEHKDESRIICHVQEDDSPTSTQSISLSRPAIAFSSFFVLPWSGRQDESVQ
jgi:hypothetical protein